MYHYWTIVFRKYPFSMIPLPYSYSSTLNMVHMAKKNGSEMVRNKKERWGNVSNCPCFQLPQQIYLNLARTFRICAQLHTTICTCILAACSRDTAIHIFVISDTNMFERFRYNSMCAHTFQSGHCSARTKQQQRFGSLAGKLARAGYSILGEKEKPRCT